MKARMSLSGVLAVLIVPAAWARLNETAEQCVQRYGQDFTERPGSNFWAAERIFVKEGIEVTIRLLAMPGGVLKTGWIRYRPLKEYKNRFSDEMIHSLLQTVPGSWEEVTTTTAPPVRVQAGRTTPAEPTAREKQAAEARAREVKELKALIEKVAGPGRCWWVSSAYACHTRNTLIIFSQEYLSRFERWEETEARRRERERPQPPPGF